MAVAFLAYIRGSAYCSTCFLSCRLGLLYFRVLHLHDCHLFVIFYSQCFFILGFCIEHLVCSFESCCCRFWHGGRQGFWMLCLSCLVFNASYVFFMFSFNHIDFVNCWFSSVKTAADAFFVRLVRYAHSSWLSG